MSPKSTTRVLVAGGGVAALEAALAMRALAEDRVSVELLAPEPQFWYRPLAVAEPFARLRDGAGAAPTHVRVTARCAPRREQGASRGGSHHHRQECERGSHATNDTSRTLETT